MQTSSNGIQRKKDNLREQAKLREEELNEKKTRLRERERAIAVKSVASGTIGA